MQFGILGPLEVLDAHGQPLVLGGPKPRALLAILLVHANQVVSGDRLIDELWGAQPPPTATNLLQGYISKLRQALHTGVDGVGGHVLITRPPGYLLQVEAGQLDLYRFEALVADARQALSDEAFDRAASGLREALSLWRGPALADATLGPSAQAAALRLEEGRLTAIEERVEADLACGRHVELVGELEGLAAQQPLRERLRGQFMLALYRSGRQAQALATYRQARQEFADELGIAPGLALQRLEQAILTHDPSIQWENDTARLPVTVTSEAHRKTRDRGDGSRQGGAGGVGGVRVERPPGAATPPMARPQEPGRPGSKPERRWGSGLDRRKDRWRLVAAIGLMVVLIGLLAAAARRHGFMPRQQAGVVVVYDFDQGIDAGTRGNRVIVDATGHGHTGAIVSAQVSDITVIVRSGEDKALQFPAPCTPSPTVTCPLAIIESPNAPGLNPGTQNFSYGADVLLQPTQISADSNIMQKGVAKGGGSQWKLRIEDTADAKPSCVVVGKGSIAIYKAISNVSIADGIWHNLRCVKSATTLTIYVDSINQGQVTLPAGLAVENDSPMRMGGKNVSQNNDNNQFFGALDNVYFRFDELPPA
ncbi:MAG: BTAD domain-containing putative transcriptional regulator [Egibacteraceae bacterium]